MPGPGWPSASRSSTFQPTSSDWNAVADAPHNWPGDANAGGNNLVGVLGITGTGQLSLTGQPRLIAFNAATQSIPNNVFTAVTWDTEVANVGPIHSTSTTPTRITIPTGAGGFYLVHAGVNFASNATGVRDAQIVVNNSSPYSLFPLIANGNNFAFSIAMVPVNAGDYIEVQVLQNSGGALATVSGRQWTWVHAAKLC